ncbi:MAG: hypothetical protein FWD97_04710 [Defluviitaleaceae bacterium]|nr:hypothetical protein [Defluviitaleaceae bacterium]
MNYQLFPRSRGMSEELLSIIECFGGVSDIIKSPENELKSDDVLRVLRVPLEGLGFRVEKGKSVDRKIKVPVLFGRNNSIDMEYNADAWSADGRIVIEVEAGRAVDNNAFLKNIFQACLMHGVEYLVLAVRNEYRKYNRDFDKVYRFLETLYLSGRIQLPLKGILLIGY